LKGNISGLFITGTDTGVGKTYVSAGIATALRRRGVETGVMKPAETGCRMRSGRLVPRDALLLMRSARCLNDPLSLVNPFRFRSPLAPSIAAERDGRKIYPRKILHAFHALQKRHDFMIVEGAGGIMVPLSGRYTYRDLARAMRLPVLIVARPALGTINHTLLTIAALKERDIAIAGVVINHTSDSRSGLAEKTSPAVIEKISGIRIVGIIHHDSSRFDSVLDGCILRSPLTE
jgi:dethiobiotin synthetase